MRRRRWWRRTRGDCEDGEDRGRDDETVTVEESRKKRKRKHTTNSNQEHQRQPKEQQSKREKTQVNKTRTRKKKEKRAIEARKKNLSCRRGRAPQKKQTTTKREIRGGGSAPVDSRSRMEQLDGASETLNRTGLGRSWRVEEREAQAEETLTNKGSGERRN